MRETLYKINAMWSEIDTDLQQMKYDQSELDVLR